jgi:hypothetical protein
MPRSRLRSAGDAGLAVAAGALAAAAACFCSAARLASRARSVQVAHSLITWPVTSVARCDALRSLQLSHTARSFFGRRVGDLAFFAAFLRLGERARSPDLSLATGAPAAAPAAAAAEAAARQSSGTVGFAVGLVTGAGRPTSTVVAACSVVPMSALAVSAQQVAHASGGGGGGLPVNVELEHALPGVVDARTDAGSGGARTDSASGGTGGGGNSTALASSSNGCCVRSGCVNGGGVGCRVTDNDR